MKNDTIIHEQSSKASIRNSLCVIEQIKKNFKKKKKKINSPSSQLNCHVHNILIVY